jgi:hypothetical protein
MEIEQSTLLAVFGRFCMGFYEGVLVGKYQSLVHDPGFWPAARRATATFSISTND